MGLSWRIVAWALAALFIAWLTRWLLTGAPVLERPAGLDTRLDYVLRDFTGEVYDAQGRLSFRLNGPRLQHDPDTGVATVYRPDIVFEPEGAHWLGVAERADLDRAEHKVYLQGGVVLRQPEAPGGELTIRTDAIVYDQNDQTVTGDQAVSMTRPGTELNAGSFILHMDSEILRLHDRVEGYWILPGD